MIDYLVPLLAGNGVKIYLNPPCDAILWNICRNLDGNFTDRNTGRIYSGSNSVLFDVPLNNGTLYYYKAYYFDGLAWSCGTPAKSVTPGLEFIDVSLDPQSIVRSRLDAGLNAMIAAGTLKHPRNTIAVLISSPQVDKVSMPVVTVHLNSDVPDIQFIGGDLSGGFSCMNTGYLSAVTLEVVAWSNAGGDERKALRKAIKALTIANMEYYGSLGMLEIATGFTDDEDYQSFDTPIYVSRMTMNLKCVSGIEPTIEYNTIPNLISVNENGRCI